MNFFQILHDLAQADPDLAGRLDTRRRVFRHFAGWGKAAGAAALPAVVGALFNKAYGQGSATRLPAAVADVLNLALQLEYLEYHFYDRGLAANFLSASDQAAALLIRNDESGHVKTLRAALGTQAFSLADPTAAAFDYTAGGQFADVFSRPATFFAVAQAFEDTGVRAYKGALPALLTSTDLLTVGMQIHSVEARHASHVRTIRRGLSLGVTGASAAQVPADPANLDSRPKSWVSGTDKSSSANPATAFTAVYGAGRPANGLSNELYYPAEGNTRQLGQNTATFAVPLSLTTNEPLRALAATEAFDEPLDAATVLSIARLFRSAAGASQGLFV